MWIKFEVYSPGSAAWRVYPMHNDELAHKSQHNEIFAAWLVKSFGQHILRADKGVMDIAGGKGIVSYELTVRYGVPSALYDPRLHIKLSSMHRRKMKKITRTRDTTHVRQHIQNEDILENFSSCYSLEVPDDTLILPQVKESILDGNMLPFKHIAQPFPMYIQEILLNEYLCDSLQESSVLIGVHSDEATEAIVDIAIYLKKPFAVVPCCLHSVYYPDRKINGMPVNSYELFISYLKLKHPSICHEELPFEGRNVVLYCRGF
jgi:hypothetical protein